MFDTPTHRHQLLTYSEWELDTVSLEIPATPHDIRSLRLLPEFQAQSTGNQPWRSWPIKLCTSFAEEHFGSTRVLDSTEEEIKVKVFRKERIEVSTDKEVKVSMDEEVKVSTDEEVKVSTDEEVKVSTDEEVKVSTDEEDKVPTDEEVKVKVFRKEAAEFKEEVIVASEFAVPRLEANQRES
ncbi:unnamed protein product [Arctogadus glacialis]